MKLFIPTIGTKLCLEQDWEFDLYFERRNQDLMRIFNLIPEEIKSVWDWMYTQKNKSAKVILPKDTLLTVDRIYIRKGIKDYDSLSFVIKKQAGSNYYGRFWAKLVDVNNIECSIQNAAMAPKPTVKKTILANKNKVVFANIPKVSYRELALVRILDVDEKTGQVKYNFISPKYPAVTSAACHQGYIRYVRIDTKERREQLRKAIEDNLGRTAPHEPIPYVLPEI